jgi:hypothetical protein
MYILSAEDNGHFGSFAATTLSMNALAVVPHSAAISRSQPQNDGSSRTEVGRPLMIIFLGWTSDGITGASQPEEVERAAQAHFWSTFAACQELYRLPSAP